MSNGLRSDQPVVTAPEAAAAASPSLGGRAWGAASALSGFALIVVLGLLWEASVRFDLVTSPNWPALSKVLASFGRLLVDGTFAEVFLPSLRRLLIGYVLAGVAGVIVGLGMGYFKWIHRLLEPLVEALRPIPSPAYIPMAILFLGIGDKMKIFMIAFAAFFPILLNTVSGVRNVDPVLVDTGRTFGLGTGAIVRKIVLPSASVYIFTGLRISLALALVLTVIAEMVAGNSGIGFYILSAQRSFLVPQMYAAVIALALVGLALNKLFLFAESRLLAWNAGANR